MYELSENVNSEPNFWFITILTGTIICILIGFIFTITKSIQDKSNWDCKQFQDDGTVYKVCTKDISK